MGIRTKTKHVGVYQRQSEDKTFKGAPDVCFDITYKLGSRKIWEKVGWRSEGVTAAMASQMRAERVRNARLGDVLPRTYKPMTLTEAWTAYKSGHLVGKTSYPMSVSIWDNHIAAPLGKRCLGDISSHDIAKLTKAMERKGLSTQTVNHALALVRRIMRKCIEWRLWGGPMPKIVIAKPDNARFRYLEPAEADALLEALQKRSPLVRCIAEISLRTGMREDEIFRLQGQHLDMQAGIIHCQGKGGQWRQVPMSDSVKAILKDRKPRPNRHVFESTVEGGGKINDLSKSFARTVEDLGFNKNVTDRRARVVFHTLRHTFASWLAKKGVPLQAIGQLLGHHSMKMTQRYAHLCPNTVRDAAMQIDDVIGHHKS